jgi:hypothetical protein
MHDILLVGNNLAMLVAALELAAKGRKVGLLLDGKSGGGHFAGTRLDGHDFDIGMVLFERNASAEQSTDLGDYQPSRRNDSARFVALAASYLDRYVPTVPVPTPQVFAAGRRHADFVVSNRLDCFSSLAEKESVRRELADTSSADGLHASHKFSSSEYDSATYEQASLFNHGLTLHRVFFDPLCEKILGVPSSTIMARYHRLGWLPLYYPETLTNAVSGELDGLAEYSFWAAAGGFSGSFVKELLRALQDSSVDITEGAVTELTQNADNSYAVVVEGVEYLSRKLALGVTQERASQLLQLPAVSAADGVSVGILMGLVHRASLLHTTSCLFVMDPEYAVYRITDQDACAGLNGEWHRISIETNPAYFSRLYPAAEADQQQACLVAELVRLQVITEPGAFKVVRYIQAANALPLPTVAMAHDAGRFAAALAERPGLELTGSLLGLGVSSLNDQIVQGLKLAEQWS